MFTMLKYVKKAYIMSVMCNMGHGTERNFSAEQINENSIDGNEQKDLKELKKAFNDGKIDSREAEIIVKNMEKIEGEAKILLLATAPDMIKKGFSALNKKQFISFSKLAEKSGTILPTWKDIIKKSGITTTEENALGEVSNDSNFHGIKIVGNDISVLYDKIGPNNTIRFAYNEVGSLLNNDIKHISRANDDDDVSGIASVDKKEFKKKYKLAMKKVNDNKEILPLDDTSANKVNERLAVDESTLNKIVLDEAANSKETIPSGMKKEVFEYIKKEGMTIQGDVVTYKGHNFNISDNPRMISRIIRNDKKDFVVSNLRRALSMSQWKKSVDSKIK